MRTVRKILTASLVAAASAAATIGTVPAAHADDFRGCKTPHFCFYETYEDYSQATPTAKYRTITNRYQKLGPGAYGARVGRNASNRNRAYIRFTFGGKVYDQCVNPNSWFWLGAPSMTVTHIRIDREAACPAPGAAAVS
ncbi:hypothetical protein [Streptomyces sp. NPDC005533]|uniref:hypothetical protein n=1 Tax=Streptomyces sp. NPDC005533 TaxID=3364723 RepID=UPI003678095E